MREKLNLQPLIKAIEELDDYSQDYGHIVEVYDQSYIDNVREAATKLADIIDRTYDLPFGNHAYAREVFIIQYLGDHSNIKTFSDDLKVLPEFVELCHGDSLPFDFVRVLLLDLKEAGLISMDNPHAAPGWKLTGKGWEIYRRLQQDEPESEEENVG